MESIIQAHRFIKANWKELDTAFKVQNAIRNDMRSFGEDTPQHKQLKAMFYQLENIIRYVMAATADVNRNAHSTGAPFLPCVAWMPPTQYDEETGMVLPKPAQPEIPHFDTKEERCLYLKSLADACLEDSPQLENQVSEPAPVSEEPAEESAPEEPAVEEKLTSPATPSLDDAAQKLKQRFRRRKNGTENS